MGGSSDFPVRVAPHAGVAPTVSHLARRFARFPVVRQEEYSLVEIIKSLVFEEKFVRPLTWDPRSRYPLPTAPRGPPLAPGLVVW